jgi:hypothetical protein
MGKIDFILKSNGSLVPFDQVKITEAVYKAFKAHNEYESEKPDKVSEQVVSILNAVYKDGKVPTVENVQDIV